MWNFINLHLSFSALAPTKTPVLAQRSHGMADQADQAPAEICESDINRNTAAVKIHSHKTLLVHLKENC